MVRVTMGTTRHRKVGRLRSGTRGCLRLVGVLLGLTILLSACSSDSEDSLAVEIADDRAAPEEVGAFDQDEASTGVAQAPIGEQAEGVSDPAAEVDVNRAPTPRGRLIRRDASVTLEVDDLAAAIEDVNRTIIKGDSYLAGEETDERRSFLSYKVPSDDFDAALDELPKLGKLRSQQVSSDDRTDTIVDLRSQLETAEQSLARTRGFFEQAESVEDLTKVESELAQREAVVAQLKAQLQNEERSVALSTINVSLVLADDSEVQLDEDPDPGLEDAFSNGFAALKAVAFALLLVVSYLLPWLLPILAAAFALRWLLRRLRVRREVKLARWRQTQQRLGQNIPNTPAPQPPPQAPAFSHPAPNVGVAATVEPAELSRNPDAVAEEPDPDSNSHNDEGDSE